MDIESTSPETKKVTDRKVLYLRNSVLRNIAVLALVLGTAVSGTAQKYDQKKDSEIVTKDGVDYLRIETKGCGFTPDCAHHVYDAEGKKIIIVMIESFKDPAAVNQSNRDGNVSFSTYLFPTLDKKAEYVYVRAKADKLTKDIDRNDLIQDGLLNEEAVNEFILVNGMKFSQQRDGIIRVISR